jgi:septal ring factor EnvC (AmiA/AmiB activator)
VSSDLEAELERRLKAQYEPAKAEKRSYSSAPTSGPASLHPTEKALRDAVWQWLRKHLPTGLLVVVLGGGSGFAGRGAQETAEAAALKAAQADLTKARNELQEASERVERLRSQVGKLSGSVEDLDGAQQALSDRVGKLRRQVETFEAAKAAVIRAEPDRAPR